MAISALAFAKKELKEGRFPQIGIEDAAGTFYLSDPSGSFFSDAGFTSKMSAITARSRILDKARKNIRLI